MTTSIDKWLLGISLFLLLGMPRGFSQNQELGIRYTDVALQIDGILDEPAWEKAQISSPFTAHFPNNGESAKNQTEVRILFDKRFLYIAAYCHQDAGKEVVVQSLKRDFEFKENDAFEIYIDAFSDANSGFSFGVNPFGVQRDGIIPNGGIRGIDLSWDGRWFAEVSRQTDGWIVEIAIPFKTLRFKKELPFWKINFARSALRQNEVSTWTLIPRGFPLSTLSLMGQLLWEEKPPAVPCDIAFIPYLATIAESRKEAPANVRPLVGTDIKIGLSPSLHIDLTVNPDFSQVAVDQQIIDLNRFELFFPEKRLFFLENSDLFTSIGNSRIRPFFSRRIGSLNQEPIPISFGGRLSGKVGKSWKVGLMDIQTKATDLAKPYAQNYMVATVQKSILSGSSLTAFLTNRQAIDRTDLVAGDFSRIGGFEFDYRSKGSKITGKSFLHYSMTPGQAKDAMAYSAKARYKTKTFSFFLGLDGVGKNYIPDLGFVPRLYHENQGQDTSIRISYIESRTNGYYRYFFSKNKSIDFVEAELRLKVYTDQRFDYQEHQFDTKLKLAMADQSQLIFTVSDYSQVLYFPFTLKGLDQAFPVGNYSNHQFLVTYETGKRRVLYGSADFGYSGEFMGKHLSLGGAANYRFRHNAVFGFHFSYEELQDFPRAYGSADFVLLGSELELSFSRNLFFTTFLQYNTQVQNFNINSRFNWRFQPLSDLYIVYISNYGSDGMGRKGNALVLKLNYWLNL